MKHVSEFQIIFSILVLILILIIKLVTCKNKKKVSWAENLEDEILV